MIVSAATCGGLAVGESIDLGMENAINTVACDGDRKIRKKEWMASSHPPLFVFKSFFSKN
jgi:hypothetical protein